MKNTIIILCALSLSFSACKKDPIPTYLTIKFTHTVDGVPLNLTTTESELPYTNAAGQNYNIKTLQYLVSNIQIHSENEKGIGIDELLKGVHFVDASDPSTLKLELGELGNGLHSSLTFNLGLTSGSNISNAYVNEDFHTTMAWPDMMGGGYHYMKMEGNFDNDTTFYNTHTGPLAVDYNNSGYIIDDWSISYSSGCSNYDALLFNVSDNNGNITIPLNMELNGWYNSPDIISLTSEGIMGNGDMQSTLSNNGNCIFSNSLVHE